MVQRADKMFDALADGKRRRLLFALLEKNPQTDSPINPDSPPDETVADDASRTEYYHVHLPKLDEYGYIEWTPGVNAVERGPRFAKIEPLLALLDAHREELSAELLQQETATSTRD